LHGTVNYTEAESPRPARSLADGTTRTGYFYLPASNQRAAARVYEPENFAGTPRIGAKRQISSGL